MALMSKPRLPDGSLGPLEKKFAGETDREIIARLDAQNAQLAYELMMKDLEIDELTGNQSDLFYQLMQKGVI
ncbi:hypothetical protein [Gracilibacillus xinjiangensis]|uniref:Uncharacterized protein n=1 Tax=Gracilibacillus xinjiangensis TaxID=1193282 RepID=A0ABV8WWB6_9BACI